MDTVLHQLFHHPFFGVFWEPEAHSPALPGIWVKQVMSEHTLNVPVYPSPIASFSTKVSSST